MRFHDGLPPAGSFDAPTAVTVGVFDGVHLGHRALLERTMARAREMGGEAVAFTFRQHPDLLLQGEAPVPLLLLEDRLRLIEKLGVDGLVLVEFTPDLRDMRAPEFLEDVLRARLGCRRLVLGFDSAICRRREGTVERFTALGLDAERIDRVHVGPVAVSSSVIRAALGRGAVEEAALMLGRPYRLHGAVVAGDHRGRELGFPTANLIPPPLCLPAPGVYAVHATLRGATHAAVANLGTRPTFGGEGRTWLEVHLLDSEGDFYGEELAIQFVQRLRGEQQFESKEALRRQIARDVQATRDLLAATRSQAREA